MFLSLGLGQAVLYKAIWLWINTYENTIFRGMNIHESQLFLCSPGVQGFDPLPYGFGPNWSSKKHVDDFSGVRFGGQKCPGSFVK